MTVTAAEAASRQLFSELKPGDRVQVVHEVKVGSKLWSTKTIGTVPLSGNGVGIDPLSPSTAVRSTSVLLAFDFVF